ncbi:MAG: MurR/RpiR family transcriptional regulator [Deltaproteobacteria bacterium]|nr:MurR/RpiR family transcriptional regulator [Deltaproteobacteria bacterium]
MVEDLTKIPKKRRRVIKYIIDNPDDVAISTSRILAAKLDVNAATIVRAAKDLGYSGYNELKRDKQDTFKKKQNPYEIVLKSLEQEENQTGIVTKSLLKDIEVLNETVSNIKVEDIENIARLIHESNRTYIFGFHTTARSIATFLGGELRTFHPGVLEITSINIFSFDFIRHSKPGDVIIGISFGKGFRFTVDTMRRGKEKGATTVAITDSTVSPLLQYADHSLITAISGDFVYSSAVAAFSLSNAIVYHFIKMGGKKSTNSLLELQEQMRELDVWY